MWVLCMNWVSLPTVWLYPSPSPCYGRRESACALIVGKVSISGLYTHIRGRFLWELYNMKHCLASFCVSATLLYLVSFCSSRQQNELNWIYYVALKGQSHEIFDPRFFTSNNTPWSPDSWAKAVLNINSYLRRYSIFEFNSALCRIAGSRF
jgi:hypothetical protein